MDPLRNNGLQDLVAHNNTVQQVAHLINLHQAAERAGESGNTHDLLENVSLGGHTFYDIFGKWMRINEHDRSETASERTGEIKEVVPRSAHRQASIGHRMAEIYGFRNREEWIERNGNSGGRI